MRTPFQNVLARLSSKVMLEKDIEPRCDQAELTDFELDRTGQRGAALAVYFGLFLLLLPFLIFAGVAWLGR